MSNNEKLNVTLKETTDYAALRSKWKKMLVGNPSWNPTAPAYEPIVKRIAAEAASLWASMNQDPKRTYLWSDLDNDGSWAITAGYTRIKQLALAYCTIGSDLYQREDLKRTILDALNWMHEHKYNLTTEMRFNWWDFEIGVPSQLNDCMILMHEHLSETERSNYLRAITHFKPHVNPGHTGANRVWDCTTLAVHGILSENPQELKMAQEGLSPVFEYADEGDGFYKDGSFIQHGTHPYTGGYAQSLIQDISCLFVLLHGSPWEMTDPQHIHVYRWIYDSFAPVLYKGSLMDMTMGRVISRSFSQNHDIGHIVMRAMLRLTLTAPPQDRLAYQRMLKAWIREDTYLPFIENTDLFTAQIAHELLHDDEIEPQAKPTYTKMFHHMARAVHVRPSFAFAVSMHSDRISNYESINGENLRGWHTSDGMTYLYNGDLSQYCDAFWPTVDSYRLPGTTVLKQTEVRANKTSDDGWAGGAVLQGKFGLSGQYLHPFEQSLTAQKSWFMFGDEIACLGSGIAAADQKTVETIVENRKLNAEGTNRLIVNNQAMPSRLGWSEKLKDVKWIHLQGAGPDSSIGYYFPTQPGQSNSNEICLLREARTDAWHAINQAESRNPHTRSFIQIWIDHGTDPEDASYAYFLLPNRAPEQLNAYASAPSMEILENSKEAHTVIHHDLNIIGMLCWVDGGKQSGPIEVNRKASILVQKQHNRIDIAVADPTLRGETVRVAIDLATESAKTIRALHLDDGIKAVQTRPKLILEVNTSIETGKTYESSFEIE